MYLGYICINKLDILIRFSILSMFLCSHSEKQQKHSKKLLESEVYKNYMLCVALWFSLF